MREWIGEVPKKETDNSQDFIHVFVFFIAGFFISLLVTVKIYDLPSKVVSEAVSDCAEQIESEGSCTIIDSKGNSITATEWSNWAENKVSK